MKTLKKQVEHCLMMHPQTRNSDIALTIKIWEVFYPEYIKQNDRGTKFIQIESLYKLPREDNVKRIRAKFNNNNQYLPDNPVVRNQRNIKEEQWRSFLGYNPELRTVN